MFLPAVWVIHTLIPKRFLSARNVWLAAASLVFYAYGEPIYILLMLASVGVNYVLALLIAKSAEGERDKRRKTLTALAVILNIGTLAFFKYVPWLVTLVNGAAGLSLPVPDVTMPVGISFYTFQILSYVLDVSRKTTGAQKNFPNLLLYIAFFPLLNAGPIVTNDSLPQQIAAREVSVEKTALGVRRFLYGLAKKLLISNTAAVLADAAFAAASPSAALAWVGALSYTLQIYFDFSGYSDMALGLASGFGFELRENFNYPYFARTIRDFWKRWHISLSAWFQQYVYIPMGGNRCSKKRAAFNRYTVFFLSGLWHGANFTFILWGLWHGTLMMLEGALPVKKWEEKRALRPLLRLGTLLAVCLGFVVFRASDIGAAMRFIGAMFSFRGGAGDVTGLLSPYAVFMLCAGIVLAMPCLPKLREKARALGGGWERGLSAAEYVFTLCVLFPLCVMTLASSSFNPFIYYIF